MATVNPYLAFDGNCMEAFEFYRSVFGGEFEDTTLFSDAPEGVAGPEDTDRVMHMGLPLGDGQVLMGSDRPTGMPAVTFGDSIAISVGPDGSDEGRRIFDGLAEGGQVVMPYERQFWGADFGACVDRFGISWQVNYTPAG